MELIEIAKITSVFGVRGEVKAQPLCDSAELLTEFETLYWKSGTPVTIERARTQKSMAVLKIAGVETADDAAKLRNHLLYADREDFILDEGCYFIADLIGLDVIDADSGREYGRISEVSPTGANDVYHIKTPDGGRLLFPAVEEFIEEINIGQGYMKISPPQGLFEIYENERGDKKQ